MKLSLLELTYNLGHVLQQQGNLSAAVAAYQQAIELLPTFAQARHALAIVLGEQGQYQAAIEQYHQAIVQQPETAKTYNNLACILALQGQQQQAIQAYQQAMQREPDWAIPYDNLGKVLAAQNPAAAAAAYRQAIALQPELLAAHYDLASLMQQQGQLADSIAALKPLLELDPQHSPAHTLAGSAYLALDRYEQAFQHFRQALLPQQAQISTFCDWVAQLQGHDELTGARQACGRFLQALMLEEGNCEAQAGLAARPDQLTQFKPANQQLVMQRLPHQFQVLHHPIAHQLAQAYSKLGDLLMRYGGDSQIQQAETYYQQALRLQSQVDTPVEVQIEGYLKLGQCLTQQSRLNAALMLYRLALVNYQDARLYRSLGEILEQQQRWSEAVICYRQALRAEGLGISSTQRLAITAAAKTVIRIEGAISTRSWCQQQSNFYTSIDFDANLQLVPSAVAALNQSLVPTASSRPESSCIGSSLNCAGLNCQPCLEKLANRFEQRHLGWGVYHVQASCLTVQPPAYFVAEVPQGQAWITPYQTPWMVTNSTGVLSADQFLLQDLCREYPGQLPDCTQLPLPSRLPPSLATPVAGTVAVLTGLSGHNYFHWMVDVLPRLALLRQAIDLNDIDWFWINSPQSEFQQTTLDHLGVPAQKILAADQYAFIQAERLMTPAFPGHLGWVEPWVLKFLRQQFLPLVSPDRPGYERIYISRRRAHHRRLLNEAAVLELLAPLGFRTVELETLTLAEQITLFAQAKVILAPHGGGLTNSIFCQPGTVILEFVAPSYIRQYYWAISHHLGLHHYFVKGVASACPPIHRLMYPSALIEDIWLDLNALKHALKQLNLM